MTQIRLYLLPALLLFVFQSGAQEPDSLVIRKDLQFHSNLEKVAFNSLQSDKGPNFLYLFIAIDESCKADELNEIRHKVKNLVDQFQQNPKFARAKEEKKIKIVVNKTREQFLKSYSREHYFSSLFNDGIYNSVSASALFAITLHELQIPYAILKSYDHIFVMAYPETLKIPIEFRDPANANKIIDDQTKQQFVNFMTEAKVISKADQAGKSVDDVFKDIYFKETAINLIALAGIQYYKRALDLIQYEQFEEGFSMAEKAYYLNPTNDAGYLLLVGLANELNNCKYDDLRYADYIYKSARYSHFGVTAEEVTNQFIDVTNKLLIAENNTALFDAYNDIIISNLNDSSLKSEISFVYNYERGRVLFIENNYSAALSYLEEAYNLKPSHVDARSLFLGAVLETFWKLENPEDALASLNKYVDNYPELTDDIDFNTVRGTLILAMGLFAFEIEQNQSGFERLKEFEKLADQNEIDSDNYLFTEIVEEVYSQAASYYYRKGQMNQAKTFLEKGLHYAPNSYKLKSKVNSLKY